MPGLGGGAAGRGVMAFEIMLERRRMASIFEPTDSWVLHRADSTTQLGSHRASEEDRGTSPDGLPPPRRTKSVILGAKGECPKRGSQRRRVGFSPSFLNSAHEVTPYAKEYDVHPSFFNFGRSGTMWLTDSGVAENIRRKEEGLEPLMLDGKELL
jgi:hypothetical protein